MKVDPDSNGWANFLRLEGSVLIDAPPGSKDTVWWTVDLRKGGTLVSNSASWHSSMTLVGALTGLGPGVHPFAVEFSGEQVRQSGVDGPWTTRLWLFRRGRLPPLPEDTLVVDSPPWRADEFGELPYRVLGATETPIDRGPDGLYGGLAVDVRVLSPVRQRASVDAHISAPGSPVQIRTGFQEDTVSAGVSDLRVVFPGSEIHRTYVDGPYHLRVSSDPEIQFDTRRYRWRDFVPPGLEIGPGATRAREIEGKYSRSLEVEFPVHVNRAGRYRCSGAIWSHVGFFDDTLEPGARVVRLRFGLQDEHVDGFPGPYRVTRCNCVNTVNQSQFEPFEFMTGDSVAAADLAAIDGPSLILTGECQSRIVDTDGDGIPDKLEFEVPARSRRAGTVEMHAWLEPESRPYNPDLVAQRMEVPAGQCTLRVSFDWRQIRTHRVTETYRMGGFSAHHASLWGRTGQGAELATTCVTAPLDSASFESPARLEGHITQGGRPVPHAMVVARNPYQGRASSDADGRYVLRVPTHRSWRIHVSLKLPGNSQEGWRVIVDGRTVSTSGEADLLLTPVSKLRVDFVHD